MISKIKQRIILIITKRPKITILIVIFVISLFYIFYNLNKNKQNGNIENNSIPTETIKTDVTIKSPEIPYSNNSNETFFINQVTTNNVPVTGHTWNEDKLIYSTSSGIYEAGTNNILIETNIEKIVWSYAFNVLIKTNNKWAKFNYLNKEIEYLPYQFNNPLIDITGNTIIDYQKNIITLYNLTNKTTKELSLNEDINKIFISKDSNIIIVSTSFGKKSYIYQIKSDFSFQKSISFDNEYVLSSISNDGEYFSLTFENELIVSNFSEKIFSDTFINESNLFSSFKNKNEIIIVEKYKDSLVRILDNIYISDMTGDRYKISDSKTIKDRINTNIYISFNEKESIATFVENNGKIWILSLKPNLFPTYSIDGNLVFSKLGKDDQGF